MSPAKCVRARHLAAMLSDYHRFLVVLTGFDKKVIGSTEGHLGCCVVLEKIRAALEEAMLSDPIQPIKDLLPKRAGSRVRVACVDLLRDLCQAGKKIAGRLVNRDDPRGLGFHGVVRDRLGLADAGPADDHGHPIFLLSALEHVEDIRCRGRQAEAPVSRWPRDC